MHLALRHRLQGGRTSHRRLQSAAAVAAQRESVVPSGAGAGYQAVHPVSAGRNDGAEAGAALDSGAHGAAAHQCRLAEFGGRTSGMG